MLCIENNCTNPYFNLASEEYLVKNCKQEVFMLWRNAKAIIVGKHQNTLSEINVDYVKQHEIDVVRRLSGGGAVFHDMGNLNFTFIMNGEDEHLIDFKKFTLPIIEVLQEVGINAKFEGRNDITINGMKFSGNAEHVFRKRILHHGTLLFSSQMTDLHEALKSNPLKFKDKAVKSVRSRVTNISDHLKNPMDIIQFRDLIMQFIMNKYSDCSLYRFTDDDKKHIQKLVDEKYHTWDWNFGYSPKYNFTKSVKTKGGLLEFHLDVHKGRIKKLKIFGDFFNRKNISEFEEMLTNEQHNEYVLRKRLQNFPIADYFNQVTVDNILSAMF